MNSCDEYDVKLLCYLDNELSDQELEDFSAHLRICAVCRARLEAERSLSRLFRQSRPLYSAPAALRARLSVDVSQGFAPKRTRTLSQFYEVTRQSLRRPLYWKVLVPAVLAVILCLVFVPDVVHQVRAANYVQAAVTIHRSYLNGDLAPQIQSDSPTEVAAWFAGKVPFPFRLPTSQSGPGRKRAYRLTGARLVNYNGSHAALVIYETQSEKITLLVASSESAVVAGGDEIRSEDLTFHYRSKEGFKVITWSRHGLSYALVSSVSGRAQESCMVCHESMGAVMR
jgi:anti-sigma factor RsiW